MTDADIKALAQQQQAMNDSIQEQYEEKLQIIADLEKEIDKTKEELQDSMNRGLKAQTERIKVKLDNLVKKLNDYKKYVEDWLAEQKQMIQNFIQNQTDKLNQRAKEKLDNLANNRKKQQEELQKKKAEALL